MQAEDSCKDSEKGKKVRIPIDFDEAIEALLQIPPEQKQSVKESEKKIDGNDSDVDEF